MTAAIDWATVRDVLLVLGPLTAAAVVAWSAIFARRAAEAAERTAATSATPLIVDVPYGDYLDPEERILFPDDREVSSPRRGEVLVGVDGSPELRVRCSVPLRNIGRGVAVIDYAELYVWQPDPRAITAGGPPPGYYVLLLGRSPTISRRHLAEGDETRIAFAFVEDRSDPESEPERIAAHGLRFAYASRDYGVAMLVEYWDHAMVTQHRVLVRLWRHPTETRWRVRDLVLEPPFDAGPHSLSRVREESPPWLPPSATASV